MAKFSILKTLLLLVILSLIGYYVRHVHFNYRLEEIAPNKVFKSALIPPEKLPGFLEEKKIQTVINLLHPGTQDKLNPADKKVIDAEVVAIDKYNAEYDKDIKHVNIQSLQVPTEENVQDFLRVMDDPTSYPVLIHCYHGTGRAPLYSALYRMEYEHWTNQDAREKTRVVLQALSYKSSFALGKEKGDFLDNYVSRTRLTNGAQLAMSPTKKESSN